MTVVYRIPRRRPPAWVASRYALAALVSVVLLSGCSARPLASPPAGPSMVAPAAPVESSTPEPSLVAPAAPAAQGLAPVSIAITAIDLAEPLIDLGLTADGGMEVPADFDAVGWFTGGGRPGGRGPLIIAAHVDSPTGPAAFIRLRELAPGDAVAVTDSAGIVHRYRVTEVADYPKADFPTARVFGAVVSDELRLITCGGIFDSSVGSYEDNRVVYGVRDDT